MKIRTQRASTLSVSSDQKISLRGRNVAIQPVRLSSSLVLNSLYTGIYKIPVVTIPLSAEGSQKQESELRYTADIPGIPLMLIPVVLIILLRPCTKKRFQQYPVPVLVFTYLWKQSWGPGWGNTSPHSPHCLSSRTGNLNKYGTGKATCINTVQVPKTGS